MVADRKPDDPRRVGRRAAWLNLRSAVLTLVTGRHYYSPSTACLHGDCGYCGCVIGVDGPKKPGECKFCDARCAHRCHGR